MSVKNVFAYTFERFGDSLPPVSREAREKLAALAVAQPSSASAARP